MMERYDSSADPDRSDAAADVALAALESTFIEFFQEGQTQERQRITREIHDSTMQLLSCLGLALARLKQPHRSRQSGDIIAEMEALLNEAQSELRTFSYLAHPPSLETMGLHDALATLVEGFGRRSGLNANLRWKGERALADQRTEIALYRIVQESLSNVHRHARAANVTVAISNEPNSIEIQIIDDGLGMPVQPIYGVGLSGMKARLEEVEGRLTIQQASPGTVVIATAPVHSQHPFEPSNARTRILDLCASGHRTASSVADGNISAALRHMASEFDAMADRMETTDIAAAALAPSIGPSMMMATN